MSALAKWYAAHPAVRRLWAFRESDRLRVIVALEPTQDGDEIYPVWLAKGQDWAHELQSRVDEPVELELMDTPFSAAGDLVAELCWRES